MATGKSYGERTLDSIVTQAERRGIPAEEVDSVHAAIRERYGKGVKDMNEPELRRLNRNLPHILTAYLDGAKRRGGPRGPWEGGSATAGGGMAID